MTEEHRTKAIGLPWCVIWIEDEDTISTRTEKDEDREGLANTI